MFICFCCNYQTERKDAFNRHNLSKRHLQKKNTLQLHTIDEGYDEFIQHDTNSNVYELFNCNKCGKQYKTKEYFEIHRQKCNYANSLQCPNCLKSFKYRQSKYIHIKNNKCKSALIAFDIFNNPHPNFIYLIHLREFKNSHQFIFKVGKTKQQNLKRIYSYPKGSTPLLLQMCSDCDTLEKEIISDFKSKYIHRKDIGNEYFEGSHIEMVNDIQNKLYSELLHKIPTVKH